MTHSERELHTGIAVDLSTTAVVVVNFGSSQLLRSNLVAVSDDTPTATYIVVDNFTSTGERTAVEDLCADHGWTSVLLDTNTGFGGGMNAGVAAAIASGMTTLVVLNPDASIRRSSIERLVERVQADDSLMIAPVIRRSDGTVWFAGSDLMLDVGRMRNPRHRSGALGVDYREWLTGACFAVSTDLWSRVGGFDDDYFLYWEDVDFSFRVTEAGGTLEVDRRAEAIHDAGGTQEENSSGLGKSELYYYYNIRNRLVYAAKTVDEPTLDRWMRATVRMSYEILLRGGRRQFLHPVGPARALIRGIRDGRRFVKEHRRNAPAKA